MIDLNDQNDPLLFKVTVPSGDLIVQWTEVIAALAPQASETPGVGDVAAAIRKVARTPDVAANATDEILFAVFARIGKAVERAGN
jgi:hypothetical protein